MITYLIVYLAFGLLLAPLSYGLVFAYWQRKYPSISDIGYKSDRRVAIIFVLLTLISPPIFFLAWCLSEFGYYGFKWK